MNLCIGPKKRSGQEGGQGGGQGGAWGGAQGNEKGGKVWRGGAKCDSSRSDSLTAGCSALSALCAPIKFLPEENFGRKCIQGIDPWSAELPYIGSRHIHRSC